MRTAVFDGGWQDSLNPTPRVGEEKQPHSPPPEGCQAQPDGVVAGTKGNANIIRTGGNKPPHPFGAPLHGRGKTTPFPLWVRGA